MNEVPPPSEAALQLDLTKEWLYLRGTTAGDIVSRCHAAEVELDQLRERAERAEDALRSLASWLSAGGYQSPDVDAAEYEAKIRWGVDQLLKVETGRREEAEATCRTDAEQLAAIRDILAPLLGKISCPECNGMGGEDKYPHDDPANKLMHGSHWHECGSCSGSGTRDVIDGLTTVDAVKELRYANEQGGLMTKEETIRDCVNRHTHAFLENVKRDVANIDLSEFVHDRIEAQYLIRMMGTILSQKVISPSMSPGVQKKLAERCSAWLERCGKS